MLFTAAKVTITTDTTTPAMNPKNIDGICIEMLTMFILLYKICDEIRVAIRTIVAPIMIPKHKDVMWIEEIIMIYSPLYVS